MTGYSDDYDAEVRMLKQAWQKLKRKDGSSKWLRFFDPEEEALLDMNELIADVWDIKSFDKTEGRMIHLMAKYTAMMRKAAGVPV